MKKRLDVKLLWFSWLAFGFSDKQLSHCRRKIPFICFLEKRERETEEEREENPTFYVEKGENKI